MSKEQRIDVPLSAAELDLLLVATDPVMWGILGKYVPSLADSQEAVEHLITAMVQFQKKFGYYITEFVDDAIESSLS